MFKTVGITGISGFIANWTAEVCLKRGYKVIGLDHHQKDKAHYPDGVELFLGDMRDEAAMTEFAAHVDGVIHLGGVLGTQECLRNPRPAVDSNIKGGLNFLEACAQYDLPGVNICVGNAFMNNPYSISKNMIERFTYMFNDYRGGKVNQLRAMNCYGPRQSVATPFGDAKVRKIVPSFVCRGLSKMPIELYGGGTQTSDMVYVEDVAEALVRCLEEAAKGNIFDKVVEIGPREHRTVYEVAELVREYCSDITGVAVELKSIPMRPGETPNAKVTADYKTLELIGMNHYDLMSLDEGMKKTVDYFNETKGTDWNSPNEL